MLLPASPLTSRRTSAGCAVVRTQEGCSAGGGIDEAHHHVGRAHRTIGLHPRLRVHRDACSSRIARTSGIAAIARGADSGHRERGRQDQGDHAD